MSAKYKQKRLNREKLIAQAKEKLADCGEMEAVPYILWALSEMLEKTDDSTLTLMPSRDAVGAAKVILLALAREKFDDEHPDAEYSEMRKAVNHIYEA